METTQKQQSYTVEGMTCNHCVNFVQMALEEVDGVEKAEVSLDPAQATLQVTTEIPLETLNQHLSESGNYVLKSA